MAPIPCLRQLLDVAEKKDAPTVALMRVPRSEIPKYGIVSVRAAGERLYELTGMVEKPPIEKAPSDMAILRRYILTPEVFAILEQVKPGQGGEIQLTDALAALRKKDGLIGYKFEGRRYDAGDKLGYVKANVAYAIKRPDLRGLLLEWLASLLREANGP